MTGGGRFTTLLAALVEGLGGAGRSVAMGGSADGGVDATTGGGAGGCTVATGVHFDTLRVASSRFGAADILKRAAQHKINFRAYDTQTLDRKSVV